MKNESMVGRRLYAWIIDMFLLFVLVFLFDGLISQPINKQVTNIVEIQNSYINHSEIYENIQDEYNIYIYDEFGNRKYNENITQDIKDAFLSDQRILELNEILIKEQEQILTNFVVRILLSMLIPSLVVFCVLPFILKNGKTLGRFAAKLNVINDDQTKITWYKILLRGLLSVIVYVYLALLSFGFVPLASLIASILSKDNKSIVDFCCRTNVVDGKIPNLYKY